MLPGEGRSLGSCKLRPGEKGKGWVIEEETENIFSFGLPPQDRFPKVLSTSSPSSRQVVCQGSGVVLVHILFFPSSGSRVVAPLRGEKKTPPEKKNAT